MEIKLHYTQGQVWQSNARFKVIRCGRQWGKTYLSISELIAAALKQKDGEYWYVAPTYRQAKEVVWTRLKKMVPGGTVLGTPNESELHIKFKNGSRISLKGADNEDSLRGVKLDGCVLDEFAFMKPYVWEDIVRPMLYVTQGWCIFISTPSGYNHFYKLWEWVTSEENKSKEMWARWHFTSYDNPYIPKDELDEARRTMTEDRFQQESMAEFTARVGKVWENFDRNIHVIPRYSPDDKSRVFASIDFGFAKGHPTAFLLHEIRGEEIITFDGFLEEGLSMDAIKDRIFTISKGLYINGLYPDPARPDLVNDLYRFGFPMMDTRKDVEAGIQKVFEFMQVNPLTNKPRWHICDHLTDPIRQIEQYEWAEQKSRMAVGNEVKYKNIPKKFDDDACFAAGTKILTRLGNVPIETISNGDDVWTPFGWSKVKNTGMTGVKNVIKFKDTWVTPNHKYFINGKFSPIDTIRYSDTMNVCEKPYTSMKYRLGDTQIRPIGLIGSISNALVTRSTEARLNFYTAQFGKKRGGIFQKVITYITQTVMLITTQSKIWFAYHLNNIISFIRIKTGKMDLLSQEKKQKYGINLKREESGIEKTGKSVGSTENVTQKTVKHVENNLRHFFQRGQSFVDLTAKCMPYEEEGELKRELKRKKSKEVPVYNLSVENGCYYADGFLVSNCDALRYFIYSYNLPTVDPNILDIPIYKPMNSKTGY